MVKDGVSPFSETDLAKIREDLEEKRDKLKGMLRALRDEALSHGDEENVEEDGSGAFDRAHSLKVASDLTNEINALNAALQMVKEKKYGVCQMCGCQIPRERLRAYPASIRCVDCKQKYEETQRTESLRNNL